MGGKGQKQREDANKTWCIGKKNKTNNDDAVGSMSATTNNSGTCTNNAVGLTSGKQWIDADRTKVVAVDTINATANNVDTHKTMLSSRHQENKGLTLMELKSLRTTSSMLWQTMRMPTPTTPSKLPQQIPMHRHQWTPAHQMLSLKAQMMQT